MMIKQQMPKLTTTRYQHSLLVVSTVTSKCSPFTYLMGHATDRQLAEEIISSVQDNGIALGQLQMLESDGPKNRK